MGKDKITLIRILGIIGALIWALTILLRDVGIINNGFIKFLLGIAPNFAVGLLIPALIIICYPIIFKREILFKEFILMLAGIAVSNLLSAVTSGLMVINSDVLDITFSWLLGSLSGRGWGAVGMILPYSIIALTLAIIISPKVNLFGLGDELASSVGLETRYYRILILLIASALAGSAVSVAGTIGFVGLIAPHSARLLIGNDHRYLVPLSALFGAILLIVSDTVARTIFQPIELSVGIITSILGAPFFLYLLRLNKDKRL